MEFKDLKLGTIIEYKFNCTVKYAVVIGISDYYNYEDKFVKEDAYESILIYAYTLTSITLPEYIKRKSFNSSILTAKKQSLNNSVTEMLKKELNPNLLESYTLKIVNKIDIKPRTQEINVWLVKNKMLNSDIFYGIFDNIDERKKRLDKIISEREKYFEFLFNKLSCYDNGILSLERNFDNIKFGEIYVTNEYYCTCIGVQKSSFYRIKRQGTLKSHLSYFVFTNRLEELAYYYGFDMKPNHWYYKPNHWYDTGVNIMTYWWHKKLYENML